jgi:hypothetical protein
MKNEIHNSYNQFYSTVFFCVLYMFRRNLVVYHQEHGILCCITQYNRYSRSKHVEQEKLRNKILIVRIVHLFGH